jgi:DNA-binding NarL/FixJ family response regulator
MMSALRTLVITDVDGTAFQDQVIRRGGEIVSTPGHVVGLLPGATDAVTLAVELQQSAVRRVRSLAERDAPRVAILVAEVRTTESPARDLSAAMRHGATLFDRTEPGDVVVDDITRQLVGDAFEFHEPADPDALATTRGRSTAVWRVVWRAANDPPLVVVVAEDVALLRAGIVALLREEGFVVAADVGDHPSLLAAARQVRPDLVITDVRMPPTFTDEGIDAAATLRDEQPELAVLVLSQHVEPSAATVLLQRHRTGIGYLLKERVSDIEEFVGACRTIVAGGAVVDPLVTDQLMRQVRDDDALARLSEREREVLGLMAQGRSNAAISRELICSPKTLEAHIRSIFQKLDLAEDPNDHRRVAAVVRFLGRNS